MAAPDRPVVIAPWLPVPDGAAAASFYADAMGAAEALRLEGEDGSVQVARLEIDGAPFWIQQDDAAGTRTSSIRMIVTVDDPDACFSRGIAAGATEVAPVADGYGWRTGRVADPFGYEWEFSRPLG